MEQSKTNQSQQSPNPSPDKNPSPTKKLSNKKVSSQKLSKSNSISTDKDKRKDFIVALEEAEHTDGIKYKAIATSTETHTTFEVPLRATTTTKDKDLDVSKTSVWVLMTLSQCSIKEVEEFEKKYKDDLAYSEKLSIDLLKRALRGDKQSMSIYWGLMEKVANRPKVLNQINLTTTGVEGGTIMSQMLDKIAQNIAKTGMEEGKDTTTQEVIVAQEGEIVA